MIRKKYKEDLKKHYKILSYLNEQNISFNQLLNKEQKIDELKNGYKEILKEIIHTDTENLKDELFITIKKIVGENKFNEWFDFYKNNYKPYSN